MVRDLSHVGRALSSPTRSILVGLLLDGSSRPVTDLAAHAGVGASAASEHLAVLLDAGLVAVQARGRQRFYSLSGPEVAAALEQLGGLCPTMPERVRRRSREAEDLAAARLCYDHLAGRLGVAVLDGLLEQRWLDEDLLVTPAGAVGLQQLLDVDVARLRGGRRVVARSCPDWTERRPHLAGALGAAVASACLSRGYVSRRKTGRGLVLTSLGREGLLRLLPDAQAAVPPSSWRA